MNIILISTLVSSVFFPFVGKICDAYSPKITIPLAFFFRCSTCMLFFTVEEPNSTKSYVTCTLMIIGTIVENISVDSIFSKNLPKETRAILNGAYSFFGQFGILVYSLSAGKLYDLYGPKTPFAIIGILDLVFGILVMNRAYRANLFGFHENVDRVKKAKSEKKSLLSKSD